MTPRNSAHTYAIALSAVRLTAAALFIVLVGLQIIHPNQTKCGKIGFISTLKAN